MIRYGNDLNYLSLPHTIIMLFTSWDFVSILKHKISKDAATIEYNANVIKDKLPGMPYLSNDDVEEIEYTQEIDDYLQTVGDLMNNYFIARIFKLMKLTNNSAYKINFQYNDDYADNKDDVLLFIDVNNDGDGID